MTDDEIGTAILRYESELSIPATDALTRPPEHRVDMIFSAFPELGLPLAADAR
jgi:hypothetical protein